MFEGYSAANYGGDKVKSKALPAAPAQRRVVAILPEEDIESLYDDDPSGLLHAHQVHLIAYEPQMHDPDRYPELQGLELRGLLEPGNILVQNPYAPDEYCLQSDALNQFSLRKHFHLSALCKLLGAKSVSVIQVEVESENSSVAANIDAGGVSVSGKASVERSVAEKLSKEMQLNDKFSGGEPDVQAARDYLSRNRLLADPNLESLVDMFSDNGNKIHERVLVFSASSEANKNLSVCGKIEMAKIRSLRSSFVSDSVKKMDIKVTMKVIFPKSDG